MIFAIILGVALGGGGAWLHLQQTDPQIDAAITVGLALALLTAARLIRGWGLLVGLAGVAGMWAVMLTKGFIGDPAQMIAIIERRFDPFPARLIAFIEEISHSTSLNDLQNEIPAEVLRIFWGVEACALVIAGLVGGAIGKRAAAQGRAAPPPAPQPASRPQGRPARPAKPQAPPRGADAAFGVTGSGGGVRFTGGGGAVGGGGGRPWGGTPRPAEAALRNAPASRGANTRDGTPVAAVTTPTIVSTRPARGSGDYVN